MGKRRFSMAWRSNPASAPPTTRDAIENILGRSCVIRGDLTAEGAIRIDGTVEGAVESRGAVVVGDSGVVRGGVTGSDVVIAGQVLGDIHCSGHLEILAKGKVEGDIDAQSMRIETGGVFCGTSRMGQRHGAAPSTEAPDLDAPIGSGAFSPAA
jgi:cytoskeletal protein CcmA (bactofilin family)